ncbi:LOW QUALITY PROTEIN: melanoma-associated antigen C3 [Gorilla gorilla gorilla]|uniref:LOW QUALITY PROTEIN: melanoma-associated antigen C3 n=1 Tax=Gorilla gorilla gorilla TaxID=9595 RepID=UPI0024463B93|nr:LOW QUALITY PROTEIN: melanoma-associated antigen C3 [Gorilla gorilla gorilla]
MLLPCHWVLDATFSDGSLGQWVKNTCATYALSPVVLPPQPQPQKKATDKDFSDFHLGHLREVRLFLRGGTSDQRMDSLVLYPTYFKLWRTPSGSPDLQLSDLHFGSQPEGKFSLRRAVSVKQREEPQDWPLNEKRTLWKDSDLPTWRGGTGCTLPLPAVSPGKRMWGEKAGSLPESEPLFTYTLDEKVDELVQFLLLKYQAEEPLTKAEMLMNVINTYTGYFPMIFRKAREFIEILFGISLTEVDPDHFYVFVNTLDLTCEGSLSDEQGMPQNRLLILILSGIFIKGNCASEEVIWEVLNAIGPWSTLAGFADVLSRLALWESEGPEAFCEESGLRSAEGSVLDLANPQGLAGHRREDGRRGLTEASPQQKKGGEDEDMPAAGMPPLPQSPPEIPPQGPPKISPQGPPQSPPQSPLNSCSSPLLWTRLDEESSSEEEDTATWHALPESESLPRYALDEKVAELMQFLLLKYQTKEPVTKAEMLTTVIKKYKDYFPMIFGKAHEFIQLIFGIALTDMDPENHSYFFEDTLDLTYEGSLIDDQGMPENCLLILILSMIFIKGSCVPEEVIWEVLSAIGPIQRPAREVLEFLSKLSSIIPSSFPSWYMDALKDMEDRAQAIIDTTDDATAMASASPSVMSTNFCPE